MYRHKNHPEVGPPRPLASLEKGRDAIIHRRRLLRNVLQLHLQELCALSVIFTNKNGQTVLTVNHSHGVFRVIESKEEKRQREEYIEKIRKDAGNGSQLEPLTLSLLHAMDVEAIQQAHRAPVVLELICGFPRGPNSLVENVSRRW